MIALHSSSGERRATAGAGAARLYCGAGARLITRLARADGLVLGRRVFLAPRAKRLIDDGTREGRILLEHELAHVEQFRRLGRVGFLWRYLGEYLAGRRRGLGHWEAYRSISLEREARRTAAERVARADTERRIERCSRAG